MGGRTGWAQAGVTAVRVFLRGGQPSREFVLMSVRLCHVPSVAGLTDYTCVCASGERNSLPVYLETMKTDDLRGINAKIKINKR